MSSSDSIVPADFFADVSPLPKPTPPTFQEALAAKIPFGRHKDRTFASVCKDRREEDTPPNEKVGLEYIQWIALWEKTNPKTASAAQRILEEYEKVQGSGRPKKRTKKSA
jgi:hypothetical protein